MSEIRYVNLLGDALERQARAALTAAPRRRRTRKRVQIALIAAALIAGAVASADALFTTDVGTELATNGIACYEPGGNLTEINNVGGDPRAQCAKVLGKGWTASRLVSCMETAGHNDALVAVYPAYHALECQRHGLAPLPASFGQAQARVAALGRALVAVERSADCVPVSEFARRAQAALDRLGWHGWSVRVERPVRTYGTCGGLREGSAGAPSISSSLEVAGRTLNVLTLPPRSAIDGERSIWRSLDAASGHGCLTLTALERDARSQASAHGLMAAFAVTRQPRFEELGDGRESSYRNGCAVMASVELGASPQRLDILVYELRGRPAAPQGSPPPNSAFHP